MVRGSKFDQSEFVDAALWLLSEGGPSAVTMAAIGRRCDAPTGSIYHRFPSRSAVVAAAWLRALTAFADAVEAALLTTAPSAATMVVSWSRAHPCEARVLLLNEPADLFDTAPPEDLSAAIRVQETRLEQVFQSRIEAVSVCAAPGEAFCRLRFSIIDGPVALIRPYLQSGQPIPAFIDPIAEALGGLIADTQSQPQPQAAE